MRWLTHFSAEMAYDLFMTTMCDLFAMFLITVFVWKEPLNPLSWIISSIIFYVWWIDEGFPSNIRKFMIKARECGP